MTLCYRRYNSRRFDDKPEFVPQVIEKLTESLTKILNNVNKNHRDNNITEGLYHLLFFIIVRLDKFIYFTIQKINFCKV